MITRKSKHEYRVKVKSPYTREDINEAIKWCSEIYGAGGRNKKYKWRFGWVNRQQDTFYFRDEKDALFFALRWS